jgi:hypothetical protein
MRVLVAADRGYMGAVLVPFLRAVRHEAGGLDLGLYEGCSLYGAAGSGTQPADESR